MEPFLRNKLASKIENIRIEKESTAYNASKFSLKSKNFIYRSAKLTPKKAGLFVTFWKRSTEGPIAPFHEADEIDFFLIDLEHSYFLIPKSILIKKGILSTKDREGKRAFRVYPPSNIELNKTAKATQKWQLNYFYDSTNLNPILTK